MPNQEPGGDKPTGPSERQIYERLFDPELTFEEGLQIYNSVVADGRAFPKKWEARILELGVTAHPDRQDMSERLRFLREQGYASLNMEPEEHLVPDANARLLEASALPRDRLPEHGERWMAYARRIRSAIEELTTPLDALHYAQTKIGFEHRGNIDHEGKFTALYERELEVGFPQFADQLTGFTDITDSAPETTYVHKGRLISNVLFYLARIILSCLTHLPVPPRVILEVGGGYGAPARLWMKNPIARPRCYLILDMPESLFFADVLLRREFGNDAVYYITSDESLADDFYEKHQFVLCPLPLFTRLHDLPVDLVINTGSLQEMNEEWVDFYKGWLDRQRCRWFYSLNYFAQPVNALWESGNLYSPRLSPSWTARLLRWNPALIRMQSRRDFLEALYEKAEPRLNKEQASSLIKYLASRAPAGEILAELMDVIRCQPLPELMFEVLAYAMRMPAAPKEALWLAQTLPREKISQNDRLTVEGWRQDLATKRASGNEAYY